jgi:hypothetical protein
MSESWYHSIYFEANRNIFLWILELFSVKIAHKTISEEPMSARSNVIFPAVLLCAFSLQATLPSCRPLNSFEQGRDLRQCQMTPGYNASARVDVRGSWDVYTTGSYIYWQPREENLELGISNYTDTPASLAIDGRVINMNYRYKSGFKAGLGIYIDRDNWDVYTQYTWLSGHQSISATAPSGGCILPFWGHPVLENETTHIMSAKGRWRLTLSIAEAELARSYYVGSKLTFRPFFAARAAWINQKYTAVYTPEDLIPYHVRNSSRSWGLGPEVGLAINWMLGCSLRLIGMAESDILFTKYNLHTTEEDCLDPSLEVVKLHQRSAYYLRPHSNLEFGFGWETYFNNYNYHFDLLGTYGFQVFWNQNMFRNFVSDVSVGKSTVPNGDLYIHGATFEARLDF